MSIDGIGAGSAQTPLVNPNATVHIGGAAVGQTEDEAVLENQRHSLAEILNGDADVVDISDEARALSQEYAELAKVVEEAEAAASGAVTVQAEPAESAAASGATVQVNLDDREGRDAAGDYYDSVLQGLRSQYDEQTAMRKFDEFMESEGFELVAGNGFAGWGTLVAGGADLRDGLRELGVTGGGINASSLLLHSTLSGVYQDNGDVDLIAATTAQFKNSETTAAAQAMVEDVFAKQNALVQEGVDFDVAAMMQGVDASGRTSAVAVDADLGSHLEEILKRAGIELGDGETLGAYLDAEVHGESKTYYLQANFSDGAKLERFAEASKEYFQENPSALKTFQAAFDQEKTAGADLSGYDAGYVDGGRSLSFEQSRTVYYSADTGGQAVLADRIYDVRSGYTYQKKVSDAFDPEADAKSVVGGGMNIAKMQAGDVEGALAEQEAVDQAVLAAVAGAVESGGTVESTMTQAEYDAYRASRPGFGTRLGGPGDDGGVGIYSARTGKRIDNDPDYDWEAEQREIAAEEAAAAESRKHEAPESSEESAGSAQAREAIAESRSTREDVVRDILERAVENNSTREVDMLTGLMKSLREFYDSRAE